jgi:hypothetical protein
MFKCLHRFLKCCYCSAIIYDYVDFEVPVLAKMHARRRAGYKTIGYMIELGDASKPVQLAFRNL